MPEKLNKDGLPIGVPVSFEVLQRTLKKHKEAEKNGNDSKTRVRKTRKPSVSSVSETEETKEA